MRGLPGTKRVEVNSLGKVIKSSIEKDTIKGKNINLSLDIHLQTFALRRLQAGNDKLISINETKAKKVLDKSKSLAWQLKDDRKHINQNHNGRLSI